MAVAKAEQGIPHTGEHHTVKPSAVFHAQGIKSLGNGKDHVEVFYIKGFPGSVIGPQGLTGGLTLGTMAVTAAVVADAYGATVGTYFGVTSQSRGTALGQGIEGTQGKSIGSTLRHKPSPEPLQDIGHLKRGAFHYRREYRVSNGLWA